MGNCCGLCGKEEPTQGQQSRRGIGEREGNAPDAPPLIPVRRRRTEIQIYNITAVVHEVLDMKDFDDQMSKAGEKVVAVDFYALWCAPCKLVGPKFEELGKEMKDVMFLKVNVDECEDLANKYEIAGMPSFKFFKNGLKVDEMLGADINKIKEIILKQMNNDANAVKSEQSE